MLLSVIPLANASSCAYKRVSNGNDSEVCGSHLDANLQEVEGPPAKLLEVPAQQLLGTSEVRLVMHRLTSDDGDPDCIAQVMHMTLARVSYRSYTEKYWLLQVKSSTSE
jgi:hypothetical protein